MCGIINVRGEERREEEEEKGERGRKENRRAAETAWACLTCVAQ